MEKKSLDAYLDPLFENLIIFFSNLAKSDEIV